MQELLLVGTAVAIGVIPFLLLELWHMASCQYDLNACDPGYPPVQDT